LHALKRFLVGSLTGAQPELVERIAYLRRYELRVL